MGPLPMAKGSPWMVAARGTEFNSYHSIVAPLLSSDLFTLVRGAQVTRLNWNKAEQRVESVDYIDRTSRRLTTMRGRAVVLAAGAVDTTTILLRSVSAEFPDGVGNSRGLVGRYLHDHPREWWPASPAKPMRALAHPMYLSRQPYDPANPLFASSLTIGLASHRINTYLRRKTRSFGVQVFGTMIPTPEIGVSLPKSAGVAEESRPMIDLRYDQGAIDNMMHARQRLCDAFSAAGASVAVDGPFHPLTRRFTSVARCESIARPSSARWTARTGSTTRRTSSCATAVVSPPGRRRTQHSPPWRSPPEPGITSRTTCCRCR